MTQRPSAEQGLLQTATLVTRPVRLQARTPNPADNTYIIARPIENFDRAQQIIECRGLQAVFYGADGPVVPIAHTPSGNIEQPDAAAMSETLAKATAYDPAFNTTHRLGIATVKALSTKGIVKFDFDDDTTMRLVTDFMAIAYVGSGMRPRNTKNLWLAQYRHQASLNRVIEQLQGSGLPELLLGKPAIYPLSATKRRERI